QRDGDAPSFLSEAHLERVFVVAFAENHDRREAKLNRLAHRSHAHLTFVGHNDVVQMACAYSRCRKTSEILTEEVQHIRCPGVLLKDLRSLRVQTLTKGKAR